MLGPYTRRSLAHGPFWKQQQEQGFFTAFLEHSEEHNMVFPFSAGQGYIYINLPWSLPRLKVLVEHDQQHDI